MSTGSQIREQRLRAGTSLRSLARELSLSPAYLSDLETGKRVAPPATLRRLAAVLGVPVEPWLLAWAEDSLDRDVLAVVRASADGSC